MLFFGFSGEMKLEHEGKIIFTLPGGPPEMKSMFDAHISQNSSQKQLPRP
jgi:molybdopterin-biosynthesis enzyme MoeA-like protein